jgi:acetylornithine deacetylase/succinyl-diaminopimelate desuccinylase-like protein
MLDCRVEHSRRHTPPGVKVAVTPESGGSRAYVVPASHPGNRAARAALVDLLAREPYYARLGGSVPVYGDLLRELGAHAIAFGFGSNDECQHAPNEFLRLRSFDLGQRGHCLLFQHLAGLSSPGTAATAAAP